VQTERFADGRRIRSRHGLKAELGGAEHRNSAVNWCRPARARGRRNAAAEATPANPARGSCFEDQDGAAVFGERCELRREAAVGPLDIAASSWKPSTSSSSQLTVSRALPASLGPRLVTVRKIWNGAFVPRRGGHGVWLTARSAVAGCTSTVTAVGALRPLTVVRHVLELSGPM